MKASVIYDGDEFKDSANSVVAHLKGRGFAVDSTDASYGQRLDPSRLPNGCNDVSMWLSHGGWDGPMLFDTPRGSQVDPSDTPAEWAKLKGGVDRHVNPGGILISHSCHSSGSNRWESTTGSYGERWVEQIARDMQIYTAGVEGQTASANRNWAIQFLQFALDGAGNRQASRAYEPGGRQATRWRGWFNSR